MEAYVIRFTNFLAMQSWQIAVLVIAVALTAVALKSRSAHIRYFLWLIVLGKCLVPPLYTIPLGILPQEKVNEPLLVTPAPKEVTMVSETLHPSVPQSRPSAIKKVDLPSTRAKPIETPKVSATPPVVVPARFNVIQWLRVAWLAGAAAYLAVNLLKVLRTNYWLWRKRSILPTKLQKDIENLICAYGLKRIPKIWRIDSFSQPFVWGLFRGSIYLPTNFLNSKEPEHQKSILGHELSHFVRFDAAVNLLQILAQAIYWFHPLVWWANKKIRTEREKCCDEMAISHLHATAKGYSMAIVETLAYTSESNQPVPSLAVVGSVKNIEERIRSILRPGRKFYKRPSLTATVTLLLFAILTASTGLVLRASEEKTQSGSLELKIRVAAHKAEQPVVRMSRPYADFTQQGKWTTKADMPTPRENFSISTLNGKIYVIGGRKNRQFFSTIEEYDPATDTWTKKAGMPTARYGLCTGAVNGKIYAIGGGIGSSQYSVIVEEYDPLTDTWRKRADMPTARRDMSSSVVGGKIYVIGGLHRGGSGLGESVVAEYGPATDKWIKKADMPTGRSNFSTSVVNGKIYAIGGYRWPNPPLPTVEEYNPVTDTWTRKADMPTARYNLSTSVINGIIYAIGGELKGYILLSTVEAYDPETDTWEEIADGMPIPRASLGCGAVNGRIYVVGGRPGPWPQVTGANEEYKPVSWSFAYGPYPPDHALHPDTLVALSWNPGDFALSHDVYFGDSFEAVNDGLDETYRGNQTSTFFSAGFPGSPYQDGLIRGTTYYWRVDEINENHLDSPWKGPVWSFTIPPKKAYNPVPADGTEFTDLNVELSWAPGLDAALHTIYFGNNFDEVSNATGNQQQVKTTYTPGQLDFAKTYYWRVDEFGAGRGDETHKGDVWSFTTQGASKNPNPPNGARNVEIDTALHWTPIEQAASHYIYFGTDKEAVRNADTSSPLYIGTMELGDEVLDPGELELETTYYWRVDEVNSTHPDSPWLGGVWRFTTANFIVVDDFEQYDAYNQIWWTWKDGLGYVSHPDEPPYTGNGTGSMVGDERTSSFTSEMIVHGGQKSMPFAYDNNKTGYLKYSEVTLTLAAPQDWTNNGVSTLSIWYAANRIWATGVSPNDAEPMYVVLNDSAVVYHDNPNAAKTVNWTLWRIDLTRFAEQGIDLTNINTIGIGFGNRENPQPGGKGLMFFDDIRLYR